MLLPRFIVTPDGTVLDTVKLWHDVWWLLDTCFPWPL